MDIKRVVILFVGVLILGCNKEHTVNYYLSPGYHYLHLMPDNFNPPHTSPIYYHYFVEENKLFPAYTARIEQGKIIDTICTETVAGYFIPGPDSIQILTLKIPKDDSYCKFESDSYKGLDTLVLYPSSIIPIRNGNFKGVEGRYRILLKNNLVEFGKFTF